MPPSSFLFAPPALPFFLPPVFLLLLTCASASSIAFVFLCLPHATCFRAALVLRSAATNHVHLASWLTRRLTYKGGHSISVVPPKGGHWWGCAAGRARRSVPSLLHRFCLPLKGDPSRSSFPFERDAFGRRKDTIGKCALRGSDDDVAHEVAAQKRSKVSERTSWRWKRDDAWWEDASHRGGPCRGRIRPTDGGGPARTPPCGSDGSWKTSFLTLRHAATVDDRTRRSFPARTWRNDAVITDEKRTRADAEA